MQNQVTEGFQISPHQEYLWLIAQGNSSFHAQSAILMEGHLNKEHLRETIQSIVARHEILRTVYHCPYNVMVPFQVINQSGDIIWQELEISDSGSTELNQEIKRLIQEQTRKPFDFAAGPLLRCLLIQIAHDKSILLLTLPALCADTYTLSNIFEEIRFGYGGELEDKRPFGILMQFADFAAWQNELLESDEAKEAEIYWQQKFLVQPLSTSKLPMPVSEVVSDSLFEWDSLDSIVRAEILTQLESAVRRQNVPASIWLHACWQVLMWRLTGTTKQMLGFEINGRSHEDLRHGFGLFARTLPIQCNFEANSRFNEILWQVQQEHDEVLQWQDYFVSPQSARLKSERNDEALFPISFDYNEFPDMSATGDLTFSVFDEQVCFDRFALKLCCIQDGEVLKLRLQYDERKFAIAEIERLLEQFNQLLKSTIQSPEESINQLEMLGERELNQLLFEFNRTQAAFPVNQCIHQLFEEQVERTPNAIAVVFEEQQLTYAELNEHANQLARRLQKLGVGQEQFVATLLERSLEVMVSALAILKAGGVYVPLDPLQPATRIALMLEELTPSVILTERHLAESFPDTEFVVICLDAEEESLADESSQNLSLNIHNDNLAYVIFTSGSTGKPKGVGIEHRQLVNYVNAVLEKMDLPAGASYAIVSTFAADLGHTVIFPAICTGGSLHIISPARLSDGDLLGEYFTRNVIDCLKIVPSHLEALQQCAKPEQVMPRRLLVIGGEASRTDWVQYCQTLAPGCRILNHYGPTETTVGVLTYPVPENHLLTSGATPLGRPLANTQIYLLDSLLQPVPFGVSGEIYIGGANVGRCYLNRPELTAERFLPDAFSQQTGARMYRTGDLARYLPTGEIEFLGRNDHQIKIRGYRIDLGEIEVALESHEAIRQAVLRMNVDVNGEQRLIAYVVPRQLAHKAPVSELRSFLQSRLPDYMIPSPIVWLDFLPLTANGKIDFRALPPLERIMSEISQEIIAPCSAVEEILVEIWKEVLKLERISVEDDFFELGGHSLLVMQIIVRVRDSFQIDLAPAVLFEATTVAKLAQVLLENEPKPGQMEKIATILKKLNAMSAEETQAALEARQSNHTEPSENTRGDQA